jgi:hypothetical protein
MPAIRGTSKLMILSTSYPIVLVISVISVSVTAPCSVTRKRPLRVSLVLLN